MLEVDGIPAGFYDVFWRESKLLPSEREEYRRHRETDGAMVSPYRRLVVRLRTYFLGNKGGIRDG